MQKCRDKEHIKLIKILLKTLNMLSFLPETSTLSKQNWDLSHK